MPRTCRAGIERGIVRRQETNNTIDYYTNSTDKNKPSVPLERKTGGSFSRKEFQLMTLNRIIASSGIFYTYFTEDAS